MSNKMKEKDLPESQSYLNSSSSSTVSADNDKDISIPKTVGLVSAVGLIAGHIIGSGIFVSPVGVLQSVHSVGACLIIWILSGVITFVGANCYTELGTMIKESGGDYKYLNIGFGNFTSFLYLWASTFVVYPGNRAVVALTFATYILKPLFPDCDPPKYAVIMLAASAIVLTTVINCISMKAVTRIQVVFMITKCLALAMIAITGIVYLGMGKTQNFQDPFKGTTTNPADWAKGIYNCVFTYAGWNLIMTIAEEVKNPAKTMPRGLWISVPMVTMLYMMTNFAFFILLDTKEMLQTPAVAVIFGNKAYGIMSWLIPVLVACCTFGALNSQTYMPSRYDPDAEVKDVVGLFVRKFKSYLDNKLLLLYLVGARNGHMPSFLKTINLKYFTPIPCLIVQLVITLAVLFSGEVLTLISCISLVETTFISLSISAMIWMRWKHPEWKRPIKVNLFFPITYAIFNLFLLIIILQNGTVEALVGAGLTLLGVPMYFICVCWKSKPKFFTDFMRKFTVLVQKICYAAPETVIVDAVELDHNFQKNKES